MFGGCFVKQYLVSYPVLQAGCLLLIEPVNEISNNVVCATSKASDQPAHRRSLIRAFASRLSILYLTPVKTQLLQYNLTRDIMLFLSF